MNVLNFSHRIDRYWRNSKVCQPDRGHSAREEQETGKGSEHLICYNAIITDFSSWAVPCSPLTLWDVSILPAMLHHLAEIVLHGNE